MKMASPPAAKRAEERLEPEREACHGHGVDGAEHDGERERQEAAFGELSRVHCSAIPVPGAE